MLRAKLPAHTIAPVVAVATKQKLGAFAMKSASADEIHPWWMKSPLAIKSTALP
jgi:hypothetical protein